MNFFLTVTSNRTRRLAPELIACLGMVFSCLLLACGPESAWGDNLAHYYQLAQENDAEFLAAQHAHTASRQIKRQAWSSLFPTISADGERAQTRQDIISSENTVYQLGAATFDTTAYTVTLSQPVFNWSSLVRLEQADFELARADAELEIAKQELIVRVAERYLSALAAEDARETIQAEKAAVEEHLALATGKFDSGLAPITDLHDAKARYAVVESGLYEAETLRADADEGLREVTGAPVTGVAGLQEEIPLTPPDPLDMEVWVRAAIENNIALALREHAVEVAEKEIQRQRAGHYPTLDAVGRMNNKDTGGTPFGGGSEVRNEDILLRLTVPVFQGGYVLSRTREAASLYQQALQNQEREKRKVVRETHAAFLGLKSAINKVKALKESLVSQQLAVDAKREGFYSGIFASIDVLGAEQNLYAVKREYAKARYDYVLNSLKLKKASGALSENDIAAVNAWFVTPSKTERP